jgi:hypothetical protein
MTLEDLKANKAQNNQHKELAPKYSEDRNDLVASEIIPTAETNYWPPEECDDLFPIICSIQKDGTLDDDLFKKKMQEIYGPASKKVSPKISVPSRHIYQLMELQVQLPPGDRSFVEAWIVILRCYEKKQQGKPFAFFFLLQLRR